MSHPADDQLEKQFKDLFDSQYTRLCQAACRVVKDEEESREIVQHAFMNLWENRADWEGIHSLQAYLYTSVYHRSVNIYKRLKVVRNRIADRETFREGYQPADILEIEQLERAIAEAVDSLPARCRDIFLLSREEGLTYKAIAEKLGISVKTVEVQMGIALKRIKSHLETTDTHLSKIFTLFF
jgi:RNA polymerase sigma-70 factor, ECF subfamily